MVSTMHRAVSRFFDLVIAMVPVIDDSSHSPAGGKARARIEPDAVRVVMGAVSDARARAYAQSQFECEDALAHLFAVILTKTGGSGVSLPPRTGALIVIERLQLRSLINEVPANSAVWKNLWPAIQAGRSMGLTPSQIMFALLPAIKSMAETYARQKADAYSDRNDQRENDDGDSQEGAPAAPSPAPRPGKRDKRVDEDEPQGPKGP